MRSYYKYSYKHEGIGKCLKFMINNTESEATDKNKIINFLKKHFNAFKQNGIDLLKDKIDPISIKEYEEPPQSNKYAI